MNILDEFKTTVTQCPEAIAVVHKGDRIRYIDFAEAVWLVIAELRRTGVEAGQKVGVLFRTGPASMAATLAVVGIGAVAIVR
jgi:acyl-CoA synthetase (AMP-forming)/AMP-acid ligase II